MNSTASSPATADHPLMLAWVAHKATEEFANARRWALNAEYVDGSLWAMFAAGWSAAAARGCGCREGECHSKPSGCRMAMEAATRDPSAMLSRTLPITGLPPQRMGKAKRRRAFRLIGGLCSTW